MRKSIVNTCGSVALAVALTAGMAPTAALAVDTTQNQATLSAQNGSAESQLSVVRTGKAGESATWTYDTSTQIMTISGTGDMYSNLTIKDDSNPYYDAAYTQWIQEAKGISIASGITSTGAFMLNGNDTITQVVVPATVTTIQPNSFANAMGITSVSLPDGLETIGSFAFNNCVSLTSITIPASVVSMGLYSGVFSNCSNLATITFQGDYPSLGSSLDTPVLYGCKDNLVVHYPKDNETWTTENMIAMCSMDASYGTLSGTGDTHTWVATDETQRVASKVVFQATKIVEPSRLAGADCFGTMQAILQKGFAADSCDTVILATYETYYDALAAAGLAGIYNCPVIITDGNNLSPEAESEIKRLGASTVVIAGGTAAVSLPVQTEVQAISGVTKIVRAAGDDAIGTALDIYNKGKGTWGDTCIIATCGGYYDALSISPISYAKNYPIFLTDWDGTLSDEVLDAVYNFDKVIIAGGTNAVSTDVQESLQDIVGSSNVTRLGGENCFGTSRLIAEYAISNLSMSANGLCYATGLNGHYDSVTGAAYAGKNNSVLLLIDPDFQTDALTFTKANAEDISEFNVLGGTAVIPSSVYSNIKNAVDSDLEDE